MKSKLLTFLICFMLLVSTTAYSLTIREVQEGDYVDQVVTLQGVVTAIFEGSTRYTVLPDSVRISRGIISYINEVNYDLGDEISVTGSIDEYYDLTEMKDVTSSSLVTSGNSVEPLVIKAGDFATSNPIEAEKYESVLIRLNDLVVTNADLGYGEWEISDTSGSCRVDDMGDYSYTPIANDTLAAVIGIGWYGYSEYKIQPRNDADIILPGPPTIANLEWNPLLPTSNDTVFISASISDDGTVESVSLYYTTTGVAPFTEVIMKDDGTSGDATVGDNIYTTFIPPLADQSKVNYYIQAIDDLDSTSTSPDNAPSNTYIYGVSDTPSKVVLNEILADPPADTDVNNDGNANTTEDEFVELFNYGDIDVSLTNWTIKVNGELRHTFEAGEDIAKETYATVFGGGTPSGFESLEGNVYTASTGALYLINAGAIVLLSNAEGIPMDVLKYPEGDLAGGDNVSMIRDPDGTGNWRNYDTDIDADIFTPQEINVPNWPVIISTYVMTPTTMKIRFSKQLDQTIAEDINNYKIYAGTDTLTILQASVDIARVTLTLADSMSNIEYKVSISNLEDTENHIMPETETDTFKGWRKLYSIADLRLDADEDGTPDMDGDTNITVRGVVTIGGNLLSTSQCKAYIQDTTGLGIMCFDYDYWTQLNTQGNYVEVTGELDYYISSGCEIGTYELKITELTLLDTVSNILDSELVKIEEKRWVQIANSTYEGTYMLLNGIITECETGVGGGANVIIDDLYTIRIWESTGIDMSDERFEVGNEINVAGVGGFYRDSFQLLVGYIDDIELIPLTYGEAATLTVPAKPFAPDLGEKFDITYNAPMGSEVLLRIFDIEGREVTTLHQGTSLAGRTIEWDGTDNLHRRLPIGVYIIHIQARDTKNGNISTDKAPIIIGTPLK